MSKQEVEYTRYLPETLEALANGGLLLVAASPEGRPNAMAIGWATFGVMWGKPVCMVMVRPSRYTHQLMAATDSFTVNVPPPDLIKTVTFCGTVSGRDHDKFEERGLTACPGRKVAAPVIDDCVVHYECRLLYYHDMDKSALEAGIDGAAYPQGNYHRLFFGEIVSAYAAQDASRLL